ncbi:hypothetical protein [uncultured Fusobacterium sp.]|uniref:hypothetical protein n=1 Tax=uncultured Fusobacterium sp. TaxID=159267 RepID=UPI0025F63F56|nr:hypothetical protein [uncultured Fusobacterium sp.]
MKYNGIIYFVLILFILKNNIFAISIDSPEFNQKLKKKENVEKIMEITNNSNEILEYILSVEGAENIKINAKKFILKPMESKKVSFKINSGEEVGDKEFFLIIIEKKIKNITGVATNLRYRIKEKYTVIE